MQARGCFLLSRLLPLLCLALLLPAVTVAAEPALPPVEVDVPSPCLACIDWAEHLREAGFAVTLRENSDMAAVKRRLRVPVALEAVHTARVAGYFIEGHVPAEDIKELLRERPKARGLAVPGLPRGAPGRELSNPFCDTACTILDSVPGEREVRRELYNTLLVLPDGTTRVWARH